jgi:glutathione S-transferase
MVLHGSDCVPCFGSSNHWLIDEIACTPPERQDEARVLKYHAYFVVLADGFEKHLADTGRPFLAKQGFSAADVVFGCELNRHLLCSLRAQRNSLLKMPTSRWPRLLGCNLDAFWRRESGWYYSRLLEREPFRVAVWSNEALHTGLAERGQVGEALSRGLSHDNVEAITECSIPHR